MQEVVRSANLGSYTPFFYSITVSRENWQPRTCLTSK